MSRLDREFERYRAEAMRHPVTRANQKILPKITLPGGVALALSLNK